MQGDAASDPQHCWLCFHVSARQRHARPAQRARDIVELLRRETPEFISPDVMWPANSPDLNPVDYRILGVMQERMYRTPIWDMVELRQRLIETWIEFQQNIVD